ncbi:hypothetical protein JCM10213_007792 [Rhodosporidiobolus nylandii]
MASVKASGLSKRSAGVRRLLQEALELAADEESSYNAAPLEDDLFSWHFTIRGPGGDFEGGVYHGKMVLPSNYPFAPPEVYMLTPSGRFETNKKICLSISSFHPETWQPSWGIRTALLALMAFFETEPKGAIGSLDAPPAERKRLALASQTWKCGACGFDAADPASHAGVAPALAAEEKVKGGESEVADGVKAEIMKEKEAGVEVEVAAAPEPLEGESEVVSLAPSPSLSPAPPDSEDDESPASAAASVSKPTTIFPSTTPSAPSAHPHPHPRPHPHQHSHRAPAPSPSRSSGPPPSSSSAHAHAPLAPPGAPRLSPAHLPPSPSLAAAAPGVPLAPPAAAQAVQAPHAPVLAPGVNLAQASLSLDAADGGPPGWIDRAIVVVLLALVAAVVRKIA